MRRTVRRIIASLEASGSWLILRARAVSGDRRLIEDARAEAMAQIACDRARLVHPANAAVSLLDAQAGHLDFATARDQLGATRLLLLDVALLDAQPEKADV